MADTGFDLIALPGGLPGVDQPVVIDGHLVTSQGPGTAMDFALVLIELVAGREARHRVESALQRPRHHLEATA